MKEKIEKVKDESILSDEQLENVTGGVSTSYQYWLAGNGSDKDHCPDGSTHNWITSANGNFEYCSKCNAERFVMKSIF